MKTNNCNLIPLKFDNPQTWLKQMALAWSDYVDDL